MPQGDCPVHQLSGCASRRLTTKLFVWLFYKSKEQFGGRNLPLRLAITVSSISRGKYEWLKGGEPDRREANASNTKGRRRQKFSISFGIKKQSERGVGDGGDLCPTPNSPPKWISLRREKQPWIKSWKNLLLATVFHD